MRENYEKPDCFTPNNHTYPLCLGKKETKETCEECNFYEYMPDPYDE